MALELFGCSWTCQRRGVKISEREELIERVLFIPQVTGTHWATTLDYFASFG